MVGYRLSDWIDIAAGPRLVHATAKFTRDLGLGVPGVQYATLDDLDDVAFGWQAGVNIRPWAGRRDLRSATGRASI